MKSRIGVPRRWGYTGAGVVISLLITCGCADLDEITQFAKASQAVGNTFPGIADEAEAACGRANSFIGPQNHLPVLDCAIYPALKPALVKVNTALFTYIASLGKLAAADLSKEADAFDKLSAALKQADPSISTESQSKASAAGGLAKAITNLWANGYRQRELAKIIGQNDQAVEDVAQFLSGYAADKYHQSLADEWRYEASYCENMRSSAEPLASDLLGKKCDVDKLRIQKQLKAIESYQAALATSASMHHKLKNEGQHWDAKQLATQLGPGIVSLGSAAVSIDNAF